MNNKKSLKSRGTSFYVLYHHPKQADLKLNMMIGHHPHLHADYIKRGFQRQKKDSFIYKSDDVPSLFKLNLTISESISEGEVFRFINHENDLMQVWDYQLVITEKHYAMNYDYYEEYGYFRSIEEESGNHFLFNFSPVTNYKHIYYRSPESQAVTHELSQTCWFIILLIETNNASALQDFIIAEQVRNSKRDDQTILDSDISKSFKIIKNYLEGVPKAQIKDDFHTVFGLVCLFGMLPRTYDLFSRLSFARGEITILLEAAQKSIKKLLKLPSIVIATVTSGLSLLFHLNEKHHDSTWLALLKEVQRDEVFAVSVINEFMEDAAHFQNKPSEFSLDSLSKLNKDIRIQYPSILRLEGTLPNFVKTTIKYLNEEFERFEFEEEKTDDNTKAASTAEDNKMNIEEKQEDDFKDIEEDKVSDENDGPKTNSNKKQEPSTKASKDEKTTYKNPDKPIKPKLETDEKLNHLPKSLPESIKTEYDKIAKSIFDSLEVFIDRNKNYMTSRSLNDISEFLKQINGVPKYVRNIFELNDVIPKTTADLINTAPINKEEDVKLLNDILITYYNPFILQMIDLPKLWSEVLLKNSNRSEGFYNEFFRSFLRLKILSEKEFDALLDEWLTKFRTSLKEIGTLITSLDSLYNSFDESDPTAKSKRKSFMNKVFNKFDGYDLKKVLEFVIKRIETPDVIEEFKKQYVNKLLSKELELIILSSNLNPVVFLSDIQTRNPGNPIIEDLLTYCISQINVPDRMSILNDLLVKPSSDSLLNRVLNSKIFKPTPLYKAVQKLCQEVIEGVQNLNIESRYVLPSFYLSKEAKKILHEQMKIIITENELKDKDTGQELTSELLLHAYKEAYDNKISIIKNLEDLFTNYISDYENCEEYNDLTRLRDSSNYLTVNLIVIPDHLQRYITYTTKLNKYMHSHSFKNYLKGRVDHARKLECREEIEDKLRLLNDFQILAREIVQEGTVTMQYVKYLLSDVKDIDNEVKILSYFLNKEESQFFSNLLTYLKNSRKTGRTVESIKSCVQILKLDTKIINDLNYREDVSFNPDSSVLDYYKMYHNIYQILDFKSYDHAYEFLAEFNGARDLVEFTLSRKVESEMDFLKEAVNEYDESHISTQVIFDFIEFWKFISELDSNLKNRTFEECFKAINEMIHLDKKFNKKILDDFKSSKVNFLAIHNLYFEITHKEEAKRKQIFKIIDHSTLNFIKTEKTFDIEVTSKITDKSTTLKSQDVFELRDRAHLIIYTEQKKSSADEDVNYKQDELEKFKAFCSLAETMEQIISSLNKLSFNGYPNLLKVNIEGFDDSTSHSENIENAKFICEKNKFERLKNFKQLLENLLDNWTQAVTKAYRQNYELTYLKGKDFWKVEKALNLKQQGSDVKGRNLLDYMGKKIQKTQLDDMDDPVERLQRLAEILGKLPNTREMPINNTNNNQKEMIFACESSEEAIIKGVLTIYQRLNEGLPSSSQILICHSSTSWAELISFAFRCFYSPTTQLHCLIQPERLSFSLQDKFSELIKKLNKDDLERMFHLSFVTTDITTYLITSLRTKTGTRIISNTDLIESDLLKESIKKQTNNCRVVTSSITGLGKSYLIKESVQEAGMKYNKIPITGTIEPIDIGRRLLSTLSENGNALCFNIGSVDVKDAALLNEILFSIIVLRSFHFSKNVVKIPNNVPIYFEIDSSYFENLLKDIEILKYLPTYNIDRPQWDRLNYKASKVQFVCHYLVKLADESIGSTDLFEDDIRRSILPRKTCEKVLIERFLQGRNQEYASFTQFNIFVDVLYSLLTSFSNSGFFSFNTLSSLDNNMNARNLNTIRTKVSQVRIKLVEGLIMAADQFTSKSVENVKTHQKQEMNTAKEKRLIENANKTLGGAIVAWENSNPFSVVFTSDNSPIFVYKKLEDVPKPVVEAIQNQVNILKATLGGKSDHKDCLSDYQFMNQTDLFEKLASLDNKMYLRNICPKCFKKHENKMKNCHNCGEELMKNNGNNQKFIADVAQESGKDYALTPDNFLKMLLIFTRVQQKIPVIIIGETGCGKTSLIRYLCSRILSDEFHLISVHAGVNNEIIIDTMRGLIKKAKEVEERLWIFLDEFNTTKSIGLIKEILCERSMLGERLPENMVFLGACNPWRLKTEKIVFDENVGIKNNKLEKFSNESKLLYTVYPLPETMIDYVWDYGHLSGDNEKKYIFSMLSSLKITNILREIIVNMICSCHQLFKKWEDVSSVSLRDIARYKILFDWFHKSIIARKHTTAQKKTIVDDEAALLAFMHCYYLRIASDEKRSNLLKRIEQFCKDIGFKKQNMEALLAREEADFLERMKPLPRGIAENNALRENVFALIVCIFTKIPLFICGKPGCSKSLAIRLVFDHFRGKNSPDPYFRTLPELIPVSFQGSEYCTSENILGVFSKAEKYLSVNTQNKEILPVVIFDEIGLAEISQKNPLKVLHNKLEIENVKVAFVGISNWRLDASKMNRALYLARPDPTVKDLEFTANAIYASIAENLNANEKLVKALAEIYSELRERLKQQKKEDMFGLRDFYFLIKGVSSDLVQLQAKGRMYEEDDAIHTIVRRNLKRNFSGLGDEPDFLWREFCHKMGTPEKILQIQEPEVRDLISANLISTDSRYLMLITPSDCVLEYVEDIVRGKNGEEDEGRNALDEEPQEIIYNKEELIVDRLEKRDVKTLVGSHMIDDLEKESYGFRVLSDIILYIEKGYTLIFKKIDNIYSSLYDLFNQSFSVSGDKKYCRIALGALYNPKCLVNENFRCVILLSEDEVNRADPPFLNRFEKYRLTINDILSPDDQSLQEEIIKWVESITKSPQESINVDVDLLFMTFSPEYVFSLIMQIKDDMKHRDEHYDYQSMLEICKRKLVQMASFDFVIMLSLAYNGIDKEKLIDLYYELKEETFAELCNKILMDNKNCLKSVVYTYSQISDDILYTDKEAVKELKLGNFKSENELQNEIQRFYTSDKALLVIRIELAKERNNLLLTKHLLLNSQSSYEYMKGKHLLLVIHLQRNNAGKNSTETLFKGWYSTMIDDLNQKFAMPLEFLEQSTFQKLITSNLIADADEILDEVFDKCLSKIRYKIQDDDTKRINTRRNHMLTHLKDNTGKIRPLLIEKMNEVIQGDRLNRRFSDWRKYIIQEKWIRTSATSTLEAINLAASKYYEEQLMRIVYRLERDCVLDSYFTCISRNDDDLAELWRHHFDEIKINLNERLDNNVEVDFMFDIVFPFSTYEHPRITAVQENVDDFQKGENQNLIGEICFSKLIDSSFYGEKFYERILKNQELFETFLLDQLTLYLRYNKIDLDAHTAWKILDHMFSKDSNMKLRYFLANSKELNLILGVIEALLTLKQGQQILSSSLNSCYNLDEMPIEAIQRIITSKVSLIYHAGNYYKVDQDGLKRLQDVSELPEFLYDNESSILCFIFEYIIEEISTCAYLSQFNSIQDIKHAFKLIEQKIIKTGISPNNLETFRPWIDLIQFIESCDERPDARFSDIVNWLKKFEKDGIFTVAKTINELIDYIRRHIVFVKDLTKAERERKILKLQTQLYKNLVSQYNEEFFERILKAIDTEPELWKNSAKIIDLFDDFSSFSISVMENDGVVENFEENTELHMMANILSKTSPKIALLLLNKAFINLELNWHSNYEDTLNEKFDVFKHNVGRFQDMSKMIVDNFQYVSFLAVTIWLKIYLFFYATALEKDNRKVTILKDIDYILCDASSEVSTLRLFVLKNLKLRANKSLIILRREYMDRNVKWIKPLLKENPNSRGNAEIIAPIPLHQIQEYKRIENVLNEMYNLDKTAVQKFMKICTEAKKDYNILICIYSWFIRLYTNHLEKDFKVEPDFIVILQQNQKELTQSLGDYGYKFIVLLIDNFQEGSFFELKAGLCEKDVHEKLVGLTVTATLLSQGLCESLFSSFLFEGGRIAQNLSKHIQKMHLFGQLEVDFVITNMRDVRNNINKRLAKNQIHADAMFIYRCSSKCDYFFYFEDCGKPNFSSFCKICGSAIGSSTYNNLIQRNNGFEQVRYTIQEGMRHIDGYIQKFEGQNKEGYQFNTPNQNAKIDAKPGQSCITFRTLHFLLHTSLFAFFECGFLSKQELSDILHANQEINPYEYLRDHYIQDYKMIAEILNSTNSHIWMYQMLSQFEVLARQKGSLKDPKALVELERSFDDQIIYPVIQSVNTTIQNYQRNYLNYANANEEEDITPYADELKEDPVKYPHLQFFNVLKLPSLEDFCNQFMLLFSSEKNFRLLDFTIKRLKELSYISSLPTIVEFTNYLISKYNYQISRDEATTKQIKELFKDDDQLEGKYAEFEEKWNSLDLQKVRVNCQTKAFQKMSSDTNLSLVLPNINKDESGILVVGTMIALANLQNEFIHTANRAVNPSKPLEDITKEERTNMQVMQTLKPEQALHINKSVIIEDIIKFGYIHNYEYGKGREIVYDFEEIESKLQQHIQGRRMIDTEKFSLINYQFELYPEGASIITDIRKKTPQEVLNADEKAKYRNIIKQFAKKDLTLYLGSLDRVFTYLRNIKEDGGRTIEDFSKVSIQNYKDLNEYVVRRQPLCTVQLRHILSLYETVEDILFDKAIRESLKTEFDEKIPEDEKKHIIMLFSKATLESTFENAYPKLKDAHTLIGVMKRLILRVLLAQVNLENRLLEYFAREDMWDQDVDMNEIHNVDFGGEIKLRHCYVILIYLENQIVKLEPPRENVELAEILRRENDDNNDDDYHKAAQRVMIKQPQSKKALKSNRPRKII